MTYSEIWHRIATSYEDGEARAIARILIEELFGLSYTDIVCGATDQLSADDTLRLDTAVRRIEQGEPLQHVLGYADFCGNHFGVNASVLIPRPETEWLVDEGERLMNGVSNAAPSAPKRILDIGTGSGCIAISLKLRLGEAYVEAWDISEEALRTAESNAKALKAEVAFCKLPLLLLIALYHTPRGIRRTRCATAHIFLHAVGGVTHGIAAFRLLFPLPFVHVLFQKGIRVLGRGVLQLCLGRVHAGSNLQVPHGISPHQGVLTLGGTVLYFWAAHWRKARWPRLP